MSEQGGPTQDGVPHDRGPQAQAPAGWYPDGTGSQRWWDGQQWTQHVPVPVQTSTTDPKTIAALIHVSGIFFGFIGPLVGYLVYPQDQFIREHSRNALNFQLTLLIGFVISAVLIFVVIGIFLIIGIMIAAVVLHIIAAIEASKGNSYTYPLTIEFIKS